ncbi:MAG: efflux RND transporter periplasmic adaptor subunit [Bacteroidales bacterium]|nr:efflux RND transporter periplasmic adaptor subunit [Bacteroidales bacterium]
MKKTTKIFGAIALSLFFIACGSGDRIEDLKSEITKKKKEIVSLNKEILELEKELTELDPSLIDSSGIVKVNVKELQPETFQKKLIINGHVEAVKQINLVAEVPGVIQTIYVEEGQKVYAGQALFTINTSTMMSQLAELQTRLQLAETVFQKQEILWEQEIGSEVQYLQAKNNKESIEQSIKTLQSQLYKGTVTAKFSGVIDKINFKEGDMPQGPVMVLVNLSEMKVLADVSESYLSQISQGDTVKLHFPSYDNYLDATISRLGNIINPDSRTFAIETRIKNTDNKYKPNMIAEVELQEYQNKNALIVPSKIVKQDLDGNYFVFVVEQDDKGRNVAVKRTITFSYASDGQTMISSGVQKGENVIIMGYDMVSSGTEVIVTNKVN